MDTQSSPLFLCTHKAAWTESWQPAAACTWNSCSRLLPSCPWLLLRYNGRAEELPQRPRSCGTTTFTIWSGMNHFAAPGLSSLGRTVLFCIWCFSCFLGTGFSLPVYKLPEATVLGCQGWQLATLAKVSRRECTRRFLEAQTTDKNLKNRIWMERQQRHHEHRTEEAGLRAGKGDQPFFPPLRHSLKVQITSRVSRWESGGTVLRNEPPGATKSEARRGTSSQQSVPSPLSAQSLALVFWVEDQNRIMETEASSQAVELSSTLHSRQQEKAKLERSELSWIHRRAEVTGHPKRTKSKAREAPQRRQWTGTQAHLTRGTGGRGTGHPTDG